MSKLIRLHLPMRQAEDVIPHLGKPTHWKQGRSAKSLADIWFAANDLPPKVRAILDQAEEYRGAVLVDAFLERCTSLNDGRPTASQTDLLAVLGLDDGLSILGVEAKVTESFGPYVHEWLDSGAGKVRRLERLCGGLGLTLQQVLPLRYQLLHRTVAAMLEAGRYRSRRAVMIVHSFCSEATGFADYAAFARSLGLEIPTPDQLSEPIALASGELRLGWVTDRPLGEEAPTHAPL